ncbi:hypothetical protein [Capnocytophaga stomatis]|nr:hypothetical protein [Capnocytophaga stomatis]
MFQYSQNPLYTSEGAKKPFGSTKDSGDKQASFIWELSFRPHGKERKGID